MIEPVARPHHVPAGDGKIDRRARRWRRRQAARPRPPRRDISAASRRPASNRRPCTPSRVSSSAAGAAARGNPGCGRRNSAGCTSGRDGPAPRRLSRNTAAAAIEQQARHAKDVETVLRRRSAHGSGWRAARPARGVCRPVEARPKACRRCRRPAQNSAARSHAARGDVETAAQAVGDGLQVAAPPGEARPERRQVGTHAASLANSPIKLARGISPAPCRTTAGRCRRHGSRDVRRLRPSPTAATDCRDHLKSR